MVVQWEYDAFVLDTVCAHVCVDGIVELGGDEGAIHTHLCQLSVHLSISTVEIEVGKDGRLQDPLELQVL